MPAAPPRRLRVAAYALLLRDGPGGREVLLTRMSSLTRSAGRWTLPGGGIDHGEDPRAAVVREVAEETGLRITPGRVLDVHSVHFTGPRNDGLVEDYHGVHVLYDAVIAETDHDLAPRVVEQDGSTDEAAWFGVDDAQDLDLLSAARHALTLLPLPR